MENEIKAMREAAQIVEDMGFATPVSVVERRTLGEYPLFLPFSTLEYFSNVLLKEEDTLRKTKNGHLKAELLDKVRNKFINFSMSDTGIAPIFFIAKEDYILLKDFVENPTTPLSSKEKKLLSKEFKTVKRELVRAVKRSKPERFPSGVSVIREKLRRVIPF